MPPVTGSRRLWCVTAGYGREEIADAMGTNRETVKSRLRYARRLLRDRLGAA